MDLQVRKKEMKLGESGERIVKIPVCLSWIIVLSFFRESNRVQSGSLPNLHELQNSLRGEVVLMDMYEALSLLFLGDTFLVALLTYIDRNNKRK